MYGVAALGKAGAPLVTEILLEDLTNNMKQMGLRNVKQIREFGKLQ